MKPGRVARDDGFTLIELLISVTILGLIAGAITAAIQIGLRTTDDTQARLEASGDRALVASWFVRDVQRSSDVSTSDAACVSGPTLVRLRRTDGGSTHDAVYHLRTVAGERRLTRTACVDGAEQGTIDVARALSAATDPTVTCPSMPCPGKPSTVSLTVTDASDASYALTGARRLS